jgi:hypothetical protein
MKLITIALLSFILFCSGCKDESTLVKPPEEVNPSTEIKISHLSHTSAREGEKIVVYGNNFNRYNLYSAKLNNTYTASNKTSDSTISLIIPGNGQDGRFVFHFYSAGHDIVLYSPRFSVEEHCTSGFCIDWNTKEQIVESDSWIKGLLNDTDTVKWQGISTSDTLFFKREYLCGDECLVTNEIAFMPGTLTEIPQFLYALFTMRDKMGGPNIVDTIRTGVVRIDIWNQILKSGSFVTEDHNWIFWSQWWE